MSFFVTRLWIPVPSTSPMSIVCSWAILRTSGEERRLMRSSIDSTVAPAPPAGGAEAATGRGGADVGGAGGAGAGPSIGAGVVGLGAGFAAAAGEAAPSAWGAGACGAPACGAGACGAGACDAAACDAAACGADAAGCSPASPMTATTVLIATVCPSLTLISTSVPATGDGISASTLSVEISKIGSSRLTVSPTFLSHFVMVPSAIDSPICGMMTWVDMGSFSSPTNAREARPRPRTARDGRPHPVRQKNSIRAADGSRAARRLVA